MSWPSPSHHLATWRADLSACPKPPQRERAPYDFTVTTPPPIADATPSLSIATIAELDRAAASIARLRPRTDGVAPSFATSLLRVEAVSSSRIEGLRSGHRATSRARVFPGEATALAREVAANVEALELALELGGAEPFSLDLILQIHGCLLDRSASAHAIAGIVRTRQNWIGPSGFGPIGALYVPPPAAEVPPLLDDLVRFAQRTDLPPLLLAAIVHAQFEAIHPFADGNGRVGRALVHVVLRQRGFDPSTIPPISAVLSVQRDAYGAALRAYQLHGDVDAWVRYFATSAAIAADHALRLDDDLTALLAEWRTRLGPRRTDATVVALLPRLVERPVLSAPMAAELLDVSDLTARHALGELTEAGVLREVTLARRNRVWEAAEVFTMLDDVELAIASSAPPNPS